MPIYEYKCTECNYLFELLQKVSDPPLIKCIKCGGKVLKTISAPTIQFKGSGWYITDYANNGRKPKESKKKPDSSPETAKKSAPKKAKQDKKE